MDATSFLMGLAYIFPAYVANASPVVATKVLRKTRPIDCGRVFIDGRRIFGDGKTIEGFVVGVLAGFLVGFVMRFLWSWLFGLLEVFLLSLGALLGDVGGAFVKRRMGLKTGSPAPVLDQLSFLASALLLIHLFHGLPPWMDNATLASLFLFTIFMHIATNSFAYLIGLKNKWY
ncbi:MAG: CDP-2,3-bis-(O-geranylgeranyl)-sn-glycerol synthase [Candidatus Caldarchaeum sp.]